MTRIGLVAVALVWGGVALGAAPARQDRAAVKTDEEQAARDEANLALARLELVQGRKLLAEGKHAEAAGKAQRALNYLRQLSPGIDASEPALMAEGILAVAARHGVEVDVAAPARDAGAAPPEGEPELERAIRGAARVARQFDGSDRPDIDNSGDARALRERTLRRQAGDRHAYRPGKAIIDVDDILATDEARRDYQDALREGYRADEVRMLTAADEARLVPDGVIAYPSDWPQRVARRQQYAGGLIARSPSWFDAEGREWFIAVYDIHDLIFVPPDFGIDAYAEFAGPNNREFLDRQALRERSLIFSGYAGDLYEGIPLLRYFGGLNPWLARGPKYSLERQAEIVELIARFTGARVETLPPSPPAPVRPGAAADAPPRLPPGGGLDDVPPLPPPGGRPGDVPPLPTAPARPGR